jgi:hypothetical protein
MINKFALVVLLFLGTANANPLRVTGVGHTEEQARLSALKSAVEQSKSVVVSESEISKGKLVKNDVIAYSSSYIDQFKIVSSRQQDGKFFVEIDVWVRDNKIADRVMGSSDSSAVIDGRAISARADRLLSSKETTAAQGLHLLTNVLNDYPVRALTPTVIKSALTVQGTGAVFVVKYDLHWNNNFLVALNETLKVIENSFSKNNCRDCYVKITKNWLGFTGSTYMFADREPIDLVRMSLNKPVNIETSFYNHGKLLYQECRSGQYDFKSQHQFLIGIDNVVAYNLELPYQGDFKQALQDSTSFKLSVVDKCKKN